jgi:hypothetical protein
LGCRREVGDTVRDRARFASPSPGEHAHWSGRSEGDLALLGVEVGQERLRLASRPGDSGRPLVVLLTRPHRRSFPTSGHPCRTPYFRMPLTHGTLAGKSE